LFLFVFFFLRDLKKTEERLELAQVKADSRSHKLNFLKDKSEDLKIRIKAAEVEEFSNKTLRWDGTVTVGRAQNCS